MKKTVIYTDILEDTAGYGEIINNDIIVLVNEKYRHDKVMTNLIVSKVVRRLLK